MLAHLNPTGTTFGTIEYFFQQVMNEPFRCDQK